MAKYVTLQNLQTFYAGLKTKLSGKVDKVEGMGLSHVDVTETMKAGWDAAEKNVIVGISYKKGATGTAVEATIDEDTRVATIILPAKFSDLENDLTGDNELVNKKFYNDTIAPAIAAAADGKLVMKVVQTLPAAESLDVKTIYLVPKADADGAANVYDEYIVVVEGEEGSEVKRAERIGDTTIDLSEYLKSTDAADTYVAKDDIEAVSEDDIYEILEMENPNKAQGGTE